MFVRKNVSARTDGNFFLSSQCVDKETKFHHLRKVGFWCIQLYKGTFIGPQFHIIKLCKERLRNMFLKDLDIYIFTQTYFAQIQKNPAFWQVCHRLYVDWFRAKYEVKLMKSETWNPPACRFWFSSRWAGALFEQDASEVEILKVGIHLRIHPNNVFGLYAFNIIHSLNKVSKTRGRSFWSFARKFTISQDILWTYSFILFQICSL